MKRIDELNFEELLMYSLAIVSITEMITDKEDSLRNCIIYAKSDFDFKVRVTKDYELVITYEKEKHRLHYGDVVIPKGIFNVV